MRDCIICGTPHNRGRGTPYCSKRCAQAPPGRPLPTQVVCDTCGKPHGKRIGTRYCSQRCSKIAQSGNPVQNCPHCQIAHANTNPYCSLVCSAAAKLKDCPQCGVQHSKAKYCSSKCSATAQWANYAPEKAEQLKDDLQQRLVERWQVITPEQKQKVIGALHRGKRQTREAMTQEERARESTVNREKALTQWENYSDAERVRVVARLREGAVRTLTPARRAAFSRRMINWWRDEWRTNTAGRALSRQKSLEGTKAFYATEASIPVRRASSERFQGNKYSKRCRWYAVSNGDRLVLVQGTWERRVAEWLTENGVHWERHHIPYGVYRRYTPDFYLPDLDIYIEVKGYFPDSEKLKLRTVVQEHEIDLRMLEQEDLPLLNWAFDPADLCPFIWRYP